MIGERRPSKRVYFQRINGRRTTIIVFAEQGMIVPAPDTGIHVILFFDF
jgi:hypothetical protein